MCPNHLKDTGIQIICIDKIISRGLTLMLKECVAHYVCNTKQMNSRQICSNSFPDGNVMSQKAHMLTSFNNQKQQIEHSQTLSFAERGYAILPSPL